MNKRSSENSAENVPYLQHQILKIMLKTLSLQIRASVSVKMQLPRDTSNVTQHHLLMQYFS